MASIPRICLNMIVKDESKIIERCLRSVSAVIDYYVIADTGSSDDTPERIESFFSSRGVTGEIHRIPFVNFEVSRNESLDRCRKAAAEFEYILLVDADMEMFVEDPGFKAGLSAPAYALRQTGGISYYNPRLIRRDAPARYIGVTHEYLETASPIRLTSLWFHDHACGSSREDKYQRDIELLTDGLQREPDNSRYLFYLAQTYKDSGEYDKAIEAYQKRIAVGGWSEESWYSLYMLAVCHEQAGHEAQFVEACLEAYNLRPSRAEPLYRLARHYRIAGKHEACMMLCEAATRIPYPDGDSLFVEDYVYHTGIREEMSICGYYCAAEARKQTGYETCVELTTSREAGELARSTAMRNFYFYAGSCEELFEGTGVHEIDIPEPSTLSFTNPSVWMSDAEIYCIVRGVNYLVDNMVYTVSDPDNIIRTQNYFLEMDANLRTVKCSTMRDLATHCPTFPFAVQGFEDCRLFSCKGRLWCTCTVRDRNPEGRCEIAVLSLDEDRNVTDVQVIRDFHADRHQKNWVPLVWNDALYLLYSTDPTTVLQYDFDTRRAIPFAHRVPTPCLEAFRGGSQAVPVEKGWIYLTHESQAVSEWARSYLHRFVLLDEDFQVKRFTEPFYFLRKGIEFCAGLGYDRDSGRFVASFGVNDRQAYLACFNADSVFSKLR